MSDIFREVDEAMQQEKLMKIWEDYRTTIIAAIVILILSTALTTAYRSWDANRDAAETERLMTALQAENPQAQIQKVIVDTRNSHEALGRLSTAGLLLEENKTAEAAVIYKEIAEDKSTPRDFRDLARILYNKNAAEQDLDILKPLLANDKSPWVWHARLQAAVIAGENNDTAKALEHLKPFATSEEMPQSLKQRATALINVYGLQNKTAQDQAPTDKETK